MKAKRSISTIVDDGGNGLLIDVECQVSNNLPSIVIVGYANKAVDEAKERIRSAFASANIPLPRKRIIINLAPADIPKDGTSYDVAIALAILSTTAQIASDLKDTLVIGELALDGDVRPVRGIIGKLLAGKRQGYSNFIIPKGNVDQAKLVPGITIVSAESLHQVYIDLQQDRVNNLINTGDDTDIQLPEIDKEVELGLEDVIGQALGKRALEIAAAGGHNILLGGPPGTGKSMLAKILPSLLPALNRTEMLEVTHLHSLADNDFNRIVTNRPFRSPHHSASNVAIVGGGNIIRPGEMSLAHKGVLLFDELPEFSRVAIEALRQPLESRSVTIARAKNSAAFPADFIFIGTANPCPCGYYGTKKACRCTPSSIERYRRKLSGPILDRIDLYVDVHEIDNSKLLSDNIDEKRAETNAAKSRIRQARRLQSDRYAKPGATNAGMSNKSIKAHASLEPSAKELLDKAAVTFGLSARAYMRTVKVSRTIADLDGSDSISSKHVAEALQYRPHQFHDQ